MYIFTEPDRTQYPEGFESISCAGQEKKTGADMVLSRFPIPPTSNLPLHINAHSLFVQIKIGRDNLSFESIHRFCARVQAQQIPRSQAILLRIGEQWQDENGLWRLKGEKPYSDKKWRDYRRAMLADSFRGITIFPECLPSMDDLPEWIEDAQAIIQKVTNETKDIYPERNQFQPDDIWQDVNEIRDYRRFFVSGLEGCGSKKVQSLYDYLADNFPENPHSAYLAMDVLTSQDEKGKYIHKIPMWGKKSRDDFRELLGLVDGWNLSEMSYKLAFYQGWQSFGNEFARLFNKQKAINTKIVQKIYKKLIDEKQNIMTDMENNIPF